jgi:hypothetical protein
MEPKGRREVLKALSALGTLAVRVGQVNAG